MKKRAGQAAIRPAGIGNMATVPRLEASPDFTTNNNLDISTEPGIAASFHDEDRQDIVQITRPSTHRASRNAPSQETYKCTIPIDQAKLAEKLEKFSPVQSKTSQVNIFTASCGLYYKRIPTHRPKKTTSSH